MQMCVVLKNGNMALIDTVNHDQSSLPKAMLAKYDGKHLATESEHDRELKDGTIERLSKKQKESYRSGFSYLQTKESASWEANPAFNDKGHSDKYVMAKILNIKNAAWQPLNKNKIAVHKEGPDKGRYVTVDLKKLNEGVL